MKVRHLSIIQRDFILNMSGVVTVILFFISGIGSYRIFIVYMASCFLNGTKLGHKIGPIGAIILVFSLYLDFSNGPIIFPYTKNYFVIVLLAFIVVNIMVHNAFKKMIVYITQYQYFNECPSCHYKNYYLVGSCANCNYKKGDPLETSHLVVDIKLSEPDLKEHLRNPTTRRMLFLLLFLIMIAIYDLWQEFPNLKDWRFK